MASMGWKLEVGGTAERGDETWRDRPDEQPGELRRDRGAGSNAAREAVKVTPRHYVSPRRPRGAGRALSRRAVKQLAEIGQRWDDLETGCTWRLAGRYPKDGLVRLEREGARRFVAFGELGKHYQLADDQGSEG